MTRDEFMAERRRSLARQLIGHDAWLRQWVAPRGSLPWMRRAMRALGGIEGHHLETHRFGPGSRV